MQDVSSRSTKCSFNRSADRTQIVAKADQDFRANLGTAFELVRLIPSQPDQKLALFWLKKLLMIKSDVPAVKRGRNDFLDYFLNVLRDAVYTAALRTSRGMHLTARARLKLKEEIRNIGQPGHSTFVMDEVLRSRGPSYMCRWSTDKRTYVAVQPIGGRGALVYMAVTDSAEDGWNLPLTQPQDPVTTYLNTS